MGSISRDCGGREVKTIKIFHVSPTPLDGKIQHNYGKGGDFGHGFYMSQNRKYLHKQFCHTGGYCYTLQLKLQDLNCFKLNMDMDWVLLIAYNRGYLDSVKDSKYIYDLLDKLKNVDILFTYIKNKILFDAFFCDKITDRQLIQCINLLEFQKQIVALTPKACCAISVKKVKKLLPMPIQKNGISNASRAVEMVKKEQNGIFFSDIIKQIKDGILDEK